MSTADRLQRQDREDTQAAVQVLREAMRNGRVPEENVQVAAAHGHPVARALYPQVRQALLISRGLILMTETDVQRCALDLAYDVFKRVITSRLWEEEDYLYKIPQAQGAYIETIEDALEQRRRRLQERPQTEEDRAQSNVFERILTRYLDDAAAYRSKLCEELTHVVLHAVREQGCPVRGRLRAVFQHAIEIYCLLSEGSRDYTQEALRQAHLIVARHLLKQD